jgi:predicted Zn-dependent protease
MSRYFYTLGRKLGPKIRQAAWMWQSAFGSQDDRLAAEAAVGLDLTGEVLKQLPPLDERHLPLAISPLTEQLTGQLSDQRRTFRAFAVHADPPNAFALPGGTVVLTASLLSLCESDVDALAFVLGHEMAHVVRGHAMERLVVNSAISALANLGKIRQSVLGWVRHVGVGALQGAYSQDQELEADRLGVYLMRAAGYDPRAACRLLENLSGEHPPSAGGLAPYFSSHPPLSTRIDAIRKLPG